MARKKVGFQDVLELGIKLENVTGSTEDSVPWLKMRGKLMACQAINKSAEPDTLMARVGFEERDELTAGDPDVYYLTGHYESHPVVLVRLSRIRRDALEGLLRMAWRYMKEAGSGKGKKRRSPPAG
jgi:hypothetical protein